MIYLNLSQDGYLLSVSHTPINGPIINTLDGLDLSGYRINAYRWTGEKLELDEGKLAKLMAEDEARIALENMPTEQEKLRADVDFLLVMGGYDI